MRIALLSDVHGNPLALDAVLADIQAQGGAEAGWLLGDYAAIGPDPIGALERVAKLPNAHFIRGNTDRYLATSVRPGPTLEAAQAKPHLLPAMIELAQSFSWTQGVVTVTGWLEWLAALPLEMRFTLPGGMRVLCVHASPGTDDGDGMQPVMSDAELGEVFASADADLVFVGHTHWPQDRMVNEMRIVNPGSVSNQFPPDLRASYVLLTADETGYRLEHRRVDYDHEAVIAACERVRFPGGPYVTRFMRGENLPPWA